MGDDRRHQRGRSGGVRRRRRRLRTGPAQLQRRPGRLARRPARRAPGPAHRRPGRRHREAHPPAGGDRRRHHGHRAGRRDARPAGAGACPGVEALERHRRVDPAPRPVGRRAHRGPGVPLVRPCRRPRRDRPGAAPGRRPRHRVQRARHPGAVGRRPLQADPLGRARALAGAVHRRGRLGRGHRRARPAVRAGRALRHDVPPADGPRHDGRSACCPPRTSPACPPTSRRPSP